MNAKLLFAATLAVALASSFAVAGENQALTRENVIAAYQEAAADGTLRKNDYDYDARDLGVRSTRTRAEVAAELAAARPDQALVGPLRSRTYNPFGTEALRVSSLPRAQVKADVVAAIRNGALRRTDYDDERLPGARGVAERSAAPFLARRGSAAGSGS